MRDWSSAHWGTTNVGVAFQPTAKALEEQLELLGRAVHLGTSHWVYGGTHTNQCTLAECSAGNCNWPAPTSAMAKEESCLWVRC